MKVTPRRAAMGLCAVGIVCGSTRFAMAGTVEQELIDAGASTGVINAGAAIQSLCGAMGKAGYSAKPQGSAGHPSTVSGTDPNLQAAENLFLRCNEIVQTANLLAHSGKTGRNLGVADGSGLANVVRQIDGEETNSQGALALRAPAGQLSNIGARLDALRFGAIMQGDYTASNNESGAPSIRPFDIDSLQRGYDAWNEPMIGTAQNPALVPVNYLRGDSFADTDSPGSGGSSYKPAQTSPFGFYLQSGYGWGHRDQSVNEDAFHFDSYSVTGGVDYNFGHAVLGVAAGYDHSSSTFDVLSGLPGDATPLSGGDTRLNAYSGSLVAAWYGPAFYVNGVITVGRLHSDITRVVNYSNSNSKCFNCGLDSPVALSANPDGSFESANVAAGYDFNFNALRISPNLAVNYRRALIDSYTENDPTSSGLALHYDEQDIESTRAIAGLDVAYAASTSFGVISPTLRAEFDHEFRDKPLNVIMSYATVVPGVTGTGSGSSTYSFVAPTDRQQVNYGVVSLGVTGVFANRVQGFVDYNRLIGVQYLTANSVTLGFRAQF